jgi:NADH-quinone oxidoreductase subunit J
MLLGTILFVILGLIAVVSAIGMLTSTNAVHAALFLVLNFATLALFYLGLNAPFLAMVQVTVYAGAIMVLFLFVIMLLGAEQLELGGSRLRWQAPVAVILVVALIVVAGLVLFSPKVVRTQLQNAQDIPGQTEKTDPDVVFGSPRSVGQALFSSYLLPFELTGVLLLVALVGAVVLARDDKPRRKTAAEIDAGQEARRQLPSQTK